MKIKKRMLALALAVCVAVSGIVPGSGLHQVSAEESTEIIDVTAYGAYPDSGKDSALAIRDAIAAAKKLSDAGKSVTISFPEGRYDIYPDMIEERELYITNTVGTDQNNKMKKIGILLEDMKNVTVDGNGSLFMFHGKMTTFASINCENVEFKNFSVDFQVPTVVNMNVESVDGNTAVVYIPECYNYEINGTGITWLSDISPYTGERYWTISGFSHVQYFDTMSGLKTSVEGSIAALNNVSSIEDLGDHRLKITYSSLPSNVKVGMCYEARPTLRDHAGTFFWKCTDVKLTSLNIHFLHGFGMVGQHTDGLILDGVNFEVPQGSGRSAVGYADFLQVSGCKGEVKINNCVFADAHDDPINIHGTFNKIVEISEDRKTIIVEYEHNETAGFPNYFEKDEIEIMTAGDMTTVEDSIRTITKVEGPDGEGNVTGEGTSLTRMKLTLNSAIPDEVSVNTHVVENITYTPSVTITNNVFREVATRGILVTTRKKILIDGNTFDGTRMASIYISNDAQGWWESGPVRDVTIRNNTFMRSSAQAIWIEPTNPTVSTTKTVHSNILIEKNTFYMNNQKVLDAKSVDTLTFKDNKIYRYDPVSAEGFSLKADQKSLNVSDQVELTVSGSGNTLSTRLYSFNGCKNVVIAGNTYDDGMNAGSSLYNMEASDVTVTEDEMKINADNNIDAAGKIYYESSNEAVVKVSSSGVVSAVGAGTASVTAYMVTGGRKFPTNAVEFTVTGEDEAEALPDGITLTAEKENVSVNGTVEFTAALNYKTKAADTITWKVYDAQTGEETDKAALSVNGDQKSATLTAAKAGVVLVKASTGNGYEAAKLVSIWEEGTAAASGISVEHASGVASDNHYPSDTVEGGLVQKFSEGGLYTTATPRNILVADLPEGTNRENLTLIYKMEGTTVANTWAEAGILLYDDADNYIGLMRKHRGDTSNNALVLVKEQSGNGEETAYNGYADVAANPVWLKLVKTGSDVTVSFSEDKENWTEIGSRNDCGFLSGNYKLAIATLGSVEGTKTYSDVTVNGTSVALVETVTKPVASNVSISYDKEANTATVSAESDAAVNVVKWAIADSENGSYSILSDADETTLTTTTAMSGKYIKAAYVPVAANGAAGDIAWSDAAAVEGEGSTETGAAAYPSANAWLKTASVTGIGEDEVFAFTKGTLYYHATAKASDRQISYTFEADDDDASVEVRVNGKTAKLKDTVTLQSARNLIEVTVTAPDGVTMRYYRFIISRTGDSTSTLKALTVGDQTIGLKEGVYEYTQSFASGTASTTITAAAQSSLADVTITSGKTKVTDGTVALQPGMNVVTVRVTPETSAAPAYYTLKLKVPDASSARLESISFGDKAALKETFDADTLSYTASTTESKVTIYATAEENDAGVEILQGDTSVKKGTGKAEAEVSLKEGANAFTVQVTSKDQTASKAYQLTINASGEVWLSDLNWTSESSGDSGNPTRKDKSCGNGTLTLWDGTKEVTYEKGIGSHAPSEIVYNIEGMGFTKFSSDYGIDQEAAGDGSYASITFVVYVDGEAKFTSAEMQAKTAKETVELDITGASELKLVMQQGSNNWSDHGDWAGAKLSKPFGTQTPDPTPTPDPEKKTYTISAASNDAAMGSVSMDHTDGIYEENTKATVTATAKEGYHFVAWKLSGGLVVSTETEYTFRVTGAVTLLAVFEKDKEVTATPSETEITVTWPAYQLKEEDDGMQVAGYYLYVNGTLQEAPQKGRTRTVLESKYLISGTDYTISGLTAGTTYEVKIEAVLMTQGLAITEGAEISLRTIADKISVETTKSDSDNKDDSGKGDGLGGTGNSGSGSTGSSSSSNGSGSNEAVLTTIVTTTQNTVTTSAKTGDMAQTALYGMTTVFAFVALLYIQRKKEIL